MPTCPTCQARYPPLTAVCPKDGTPLGNDLALGETEPGTPPSDPRPVKEDSLVGMTLADKFKITRRLGAGGMGVVYEATHAKIGRPVAIKVLHERYAERPEVAARLMNEARLASSIHHEHIVDIFDMGETPQGLSYVVMELLDGESLAERIRRDGPLDEARAIAIGLQAASALGAAHAQGIIHRDVKPENVFLVRRDGTDFVKVVDFGISKLTRLGPDGEPATPRLTQTGMVLGTPLYMSPEQARGEDDLDQRIDVYALGVILYECLTGAVPFGGTNYLGIIQQVLQEAPVPLGQRAPDRRISESIERVVLKALAKSRDQRYPNMEALAADLKRAAAGETVEAPGPVAAKGAATPLPRRSTGFVAAAAAIVVAGGIAAFLALGRGPHPEAAPPPLPAPTASLPPAAPTPPPLSASVIVKVFSTPPGAEILDGARRLGVAPASIELARSDKAVKLTFRLAGYEDGSTNVVPKIENEQLNIELRPLKKAPRSKVKAQPIGTTVAKPNAPDSAPAGSPYSSKKE